MNLLQHEQLQMHLRMVMNTLKANGSITDFIKDQLHKAMNISTHAMNEEKSKYDDICDVVAAEVRRAKTLFPENFHNQHEGYAVILEELDELWDEVKKNQRNYDLEAQKKEAIQCAAMCIRFAAELT